MPVPIGPLRSIFQYNSSFAAPPPKDAGSEPIWDSMIPSKSQTLYPLPSRSENYCRWPRLHQRPNHRNGNLCPQRIPSAALPSIHRFSSQAQTLLKLRAVHSSSGLLLQFNDRRRLRSIRPRKAKKTPCSTLLRLPPTGDSMLGRLKH